MSRHVLILNERDLENPRAGGAEIHLFEIFGRLAAGGDRVTMLCAGVPGGRCAVHHGRLARIEVANPDRRALRLLNAAQRAGIAPISVSNALKRGSSRASSSCAMHRSR